MGLSKLSAECPQRHKDWPLPETDVWREYFVGLSVIQRTLVLPLNCYCAGASRHDLGPSPAREWRTEVALVACF